MSSQGLLLLAAIFAPSVTLHASPGDAERATRIAAQRELARDPQWRALLHCTDSNLQRCSTAVSSVAFFVTPESADDPARELEENIKSIFSGSYRSDNHPSHTHSPSESAPFECRYPARFEWLLEQLNSSGINFPRHECKELQEWFSGIQPHALSVIFPSSFINNPASAFGHTLLRIDQENQDEQTRLVAYTANFAANTRGDDAVSYALRGVFGGYDGFFSVAPYYEKVKKYSDLEDRDIWEYHLAFTPAEARRLTLHLWELRDVPFSYYYFDENCAYQLLSLLEAARPSLALSKRFVTWVLPVDTLRVLLQEEGIFQRAVFRPSVATKLAHTASHASDVQRRWALDAADPTQSLPEDELKELAGEDAVERVDLAYDILTYQTLRGVVEGSERDNRAWKLLSLRSSLPGASSVPPLPQPSARPEEGHSTFRLSVGGGREGGRWFSEYGIRPAFHDQLDRPEGYLPGSQMRFFDTAIRHEEDRGLRLQRFTVIDLESLSPRDAFFSPKSWSLRLGAERRESSRDDDPFVFSFEGGAGGSFRTPGNGILYGLLEAEAQSSKGLDPEWALGAGPRTGLLLQLDRTWRMQVEGSVQRFALGEEHTENQGRMVHNVALSRNTAVRLTLARTHMLDEWETSAMSELHYFFDPVSDK